MSNFWKGFAALVTLIVAVLAGRYAWDVFFPERPTVVVDRLCQFVRDDQRMECVAVLASDTLMKPGSIVDYRVAPGAPPERVPLPVADLFGPSCAVPGVDMTDLRKRLLEPQRISIPQLTYETNRALQIGGDVDVPQFNGFSFKAGPKWSNVSKIELSSDDAWATTLDELSAVTAYGSCQIRKECTDYVKSARYRVIGIAVVAKGLTYRAYNKRGDLISLEAGAKTDTFNISVGGNTDIGATTDATIKANGARVVGVRLMPETIFDGHQSCDETVVFQPPSGIAHVSLSGGGGKGSLGEPRDDERPIGETASLSAGGTEESECEPSFERKRSAAAGEARVEADGPSTVRFSYKLRAEGGHYVTTAACVAGKVVGKTGHDTTATASAELRATIYVIVRGDTSPRLQLTYLNMPQDTHLDAVDWKSQRLDMVTREFVKGDPVTRRSALTPTIAGSGDTVVATSGPGVYRIEVSFRTNASVTGNVNDVRQQIASMRVTLAQ